MIASGSFSTYNFDGDNLAQRLKLYNTNTPEFRKATFVKNSSKGNAGKNKGYGAPEYIGRDPRLTVSVSKIAQNSVTVQFATRANVQRVHERRSYVSTVDEMLNRAARKCTAVVNKIIAECNKEKKKFFDKSFHFGDRMTMYPPGSPNDCTVSEPRRIARLSDLYPDSSLFGNNARGDYFQGAIGDCFYIGAVAAMWGSSIPDSTKPIERLFPAHSQDFGVYGVLFFKNGGWEWVVVDDFIAVQDDGVTPLYSNVNCKILWPLILEKAYAKVHFCWDSIDGGWLREALADITGGIEYTIDLAGVHRKMTFAEFSSWVDDPYTVLGCAVGQHVREVGGSGRAGELQTVHGLFKGHAYSVLKAIQTSDGEQFIRVRNPWGNEAEWTGAYSDRAIDWKRNQLHFRELCPEFKDDGAFWMKWQDFKQFFSDVDVCRFFSQNLKCIMTYGISVRTPIVPNNLFILGIKTSRPTTKIVLSLGQDDPKAQSNHREAKTLPYAIIRLSIKALKTVPKSFTELQGSLSRSIDTNKVYNRQVHEDLDLPNGFYSLVPQFFDAPPGIGFYLGCFCDAEDEVFLYRFDSKESTFLTTEKNGVVSQEIPANVPQPVMDVIAPPAPSSNNAGSLTVGQSNVTLFSMAGGIEKAVEEAFRYADVSGRGFIEASTATHTFSRLLMQSDIGRHFRQFLQNMGTGSINRSAFNDLVADILEKNLGSKAAVNALFTIEGGFSLCCRNAFNRTDSWNAGRLYRLHSELALSRLLMMSDIGCEFRNLLQRTGTYQLTLMQMQKLCHQAICQHDFN